LTTTPAPGRQAPAGASAQSAPAAAGAASQERLGSATGGPSVAHQASATPAMSVDLISDDAWRAPRGAGAAPYGHEVALADEPILELAPVLEPEALTTPGGPTRAATTQPPSPATPAPLAPLLFALPAGGGGPPSLAAIAPRRLEAAAGTTASRNGSPHRAQEFAPQLTPIGGNLGPFADSGGLPGGAAGAVASVIQLAILFASLSLFPPRASMRRFGLRAAHMRPAFSQVVEHPG
jgi:hypothetical protein